MSANSPTPRLLLGLGISLAAVCVFFWYTRNQISRLRTLQTEIVDVNRHDSLQLLRVQNDMNSLAQALRDLRDGVDVRPPNEVHATFRAIREDLEEVLEQHKPTNQEDSSDDEARHRDLVALLAKFWTDVDRMYTLSSAGNDAEARNFIVRRLQPEQRAINTQIATLLLHNHEENAVAAARIHGIYVEVERNLYFFLVGMLLFMVASGLHSIWTNRLLFEQVKRLAEQRRVLAARLFSVQEDILRSVSRELHDEFGQILTAIGALLIRAEKKGLPKDSLFCKDLLEVREIAQESLGKVRTLSHALHPTILDDHGLEKAIEWHASRYEKQTNITVHYKKTGSLGKVADTTAVHVFRIVQEALNNVARHAGVHEALLRAAYSNGSMRLEVEDHGVGFSPLDVKHGLGLVAMRERAELVGGFDRVRAACRGRNALGNQNPVKEGQHRMSDKIRVLLADDHVLVRRGFRRILEDDDDIEIVAEASNGKEAVELSERILPNVVVMDLYMPDMDGVQATMQIRKRCAGTNVLVLSMYADANYVRNALAAGAMGYMLKNAIELDLVAGVREVAAGRRYFSPGISLPDEGEEDELDKLTQRERQVLQLIAQGKSTREIAALLRLSPNTIAVHRANLMQALGMHRTAELVSFAIRKGLAPMP